MLRAVGTEHRHRLLRLKSGLRAASVLARFAFVEDPGGGVGMEILAEDLAAVASAAGTALCRYVCDAEGVIERDAFPVSAVGLNEKTALVALLSELLFRMETDRLALRRFAFEGIAPVPEPEAGGRRQLRIRGTAFGEPFDRARHRPLFPVRAVLIRGLKLKPEAGGLRFYCVLDA